MLDMIGSVGQCGWVGGYLDVDCKDLKCADLASLCRHSQGRLAWCSLIFIFKFGARLESNTLFKMYLSHFFFFVTALFRNHKFKSRLIIFECAGKVQQVTIIERSSSLLLQKTAFSLVKSRLALGSPGCSVGRHHAENGPIHRQLAVDCPLVITSIVETLFQTRLEKRNN